MAVYDLLRERKEGTRAELVGGIDYQHLDYASRDSCWSNLIRPSIRKLPGVNPPKPGDDQWEFEEPTGAES